MRDLSEFLKATNLPAEAVERMLLVTLLHEALENKPEPGGGPTIADFAATREHVEKDVIAELSGALSGAPVRPGGEMSITASVRAALSGWRVPRPGDLVQLRSGTAAALMLKRYTVPPDQVVPGEKYAVIGAATAMPLENTLPAEDPDRWNKAAVHAVFLRTKNEVMQIVPIEALEPAE